MGYFWQVNDLKEIWSLKKQQKFFQAVSVSALLYGLSSWYLMKQLEKKARWELRKDAVLNKFWK